MSKPFIKNSQGFISVFVIAIGMMAIMFSVGFAESFRNTSDLQLRTLDKQQKGEYLKNFADYIEHLPQNHLQALGENFNGLGNRVSGRITHETSIIEEALDHSQSSPVYTLNNIPITIEWNQCAGGETGILAVNGAVIDNENINCALNEEYSQKLTLPVAPDSLLLSSIAGLLHFRVTSASNAFLQDTMWHLNLSIPLDYGVLGETIEIQRIF